jgi:hypothetical protein
MQELVGFVLSVDSSAERLSRHPDRTARPPDHRLRAVLTCSLGEGEELGADAGPPAAAPRGVRMSRRALGRRGESGRFGGA